VVIELLALEIFRKHIICSWFKLWTDGWIS